MAVLVGLSACQRAPEQELVDALKAQWKPGQDIVLLPGYVNERLEKELTRSGLAFVRDPARTGIEERIHQASVRFRGSPGKAIWLIWDRHDKATDRAVEVSMLRDFPVPFQKDFNGVGLAAVVNDLKPFATEVAEKPADALLRLTPVAKGQNIVTDIQFLPDGETMLFTEKTGNITWHNLLS
ncbi:MAG: hypothetical protein AAF492_07360, partial [Verrucomicrobiota bacterium]